LRFFTAEKTRNPGAGEWSEKPDSSLSDPYQPINLSNCFDGAIFSKKSWRQEKFFGLFIRNLYIIIGDKIDLNIKVLYNEAKDKND